MKTNNNIPVYRFQGYADDWELRKLGEVANFSKGNGYSKKDLVEEGSPIILYGRLYTRYETVISEIDTFVLDEENRSNTVFSEGGEVLVPTSGESALDIARASVVLEKGIVLGGDLNIIRIISEISPIFLALTISNGKTQKELSKRAQGKSVVHLHNSDLKEVEFMVPSLTEQKAIGTFFSILDQQITLHQRKLDTLKEQKKTYLKLLFPAKGQTKPSLRFQGFEDDWEEVKLGEVCTIQGGNAWKSDSYSLTGEYLVVTIANVTGEYFIDDKKGNRIDINPNEMQYVLKKGDILISLTGNVGRVSKMTESKGVLNQRVGKLTTTANFEFIFSILRTEKFENEMRLASQGAAQANISNKDVLQYMISLPSHPEQEAIGSFFQTLDQEISQVEDKLASLKEMKKTLLRKLFV
ncbi:restriction endonuclease subunit S [Streptococcus suis]|uniref:restriction endonuclease subunit S n=1 Tax=Streptococcus suis TaxID=1307 RepID=UPI0037574265